MYCKTLSKKSNMYTLIQLNLFAYVVRIHTNNKNLRENVNSVSTSMLTFGCTYFFQRYVLQKYLKLNNKIAKPNPHVTYARIALKPLQNMEIF